MYAVQITKQRSLLTVQSLYEGNERGIFDIVVSTINDQIQSDLCVRMETRIRKLQ